MDDAEIVQALVDELAQVASAFAISPAAIHDALFAESNEWAFLLKAHALVETAVSYLIAHACTDSRAKIALEELSKGTLDRKLKLSKRMQLLDDDHFPAAKLLSEIRNKVVHDIRQVDFTFDAFLDAHDLRNRFLDVFTAFYARRDEMRGQPPKTLVGMAVMMLLFNARRSHLETNAPPLKNLGLLSS